MTISTKRSTGVVQPGTKFARAKNLIEAPDYEKSAALLTEAGVSDLSLTLTVMNDSIRTRDRADHPGQPRTGRHQGRDPAL